MQTHPAPWLGTAIPIVVIAIVMGLRLRAMKRERRLRLETLWILPALYLVVAAVIFWTTPPSPRGWAMAVGALAIGAGIGWQRGRLMTIRVDPETHALSQRSSPAALLILVVLVALRTGLRSAAAREGGGWHLDAAMLTEALVALALGMFAATRIEMFLRARRLLDAARSQRMTA